MTITAYLSIVRELLLSPNLPEAAIVVYWLQGMCPIAAADLIHCCPNL